MAEGEDMWSTIASLIPVFLAQISTTCSTTSSSLRIGNLVAGELHFPVLVINHHVNMCWVEKTSQPKIQGEGVCIATLDCRLYCIVARIVAVRVGQDNVLRELI